KNALEQFSRDTLTSGKADDIAKLNDFLLTTAGKLNRTIAKVGGGHEANYLSRLELIQEFMKIHPRIFAGLKELDDVPYKSMDIVDSIIELRVECDKLAAQINEEIEDITKKMKETLTELKELLA
ncbi:MAG: hypothetical protein ACXABH_11840, partial [Candidatus Thorarchaeota archaeon]